MMPLEMYKKRLIRIWLVGFVALALLFGTAKYFNPNGEVRSLAHDVIVTLAVAILLPTLIVVRAYYRYKRWLKEQGHEK